MVVAWQTSLLASDVPRPDATWSACTRSDVGRGAWVDHQPDWLAGSDTLFADLLATAPWRQRTRAMYDKVVDEPRLTAWWGAEDSDRRLPSVVVEVRELLSSRYGVTFDSVGCNLYRDGHDSVAWHGDTVRKQQAEPIVAIVSLGPRRKLLLRPRGGGPSRRYDLGRGDLFVMGGTCQHTWEHSVPKVRAAGPRMSVTFRHSSAAPARSAAPATRSRAGRAGSG
jgi:alkylated DNA repair dioxygenase AlkB